MSTKTKVGAEPVGSADWDAFCDRLKAAGQLLARPEIPANDLDRAEGLRYLARMTRVALELCFEHSDPDFPTFLNAWNATAKAGADNPDNLYLNSNIAGDREYRLRGRRGTGPSLRFETLADRFATEGIMASTGLLRASDITFESDGSFEITVSREPRPGNWLPLAPDSCVLLVRQSFADRTRDVPVTVTIERIGAAITPTPLSGKNANWALRAAASFVSRVTNQYAGWAQWFQARPNDLHDIETTPFREDGGDVNTRYLHGYWTLEADEALVVETEVPVCDGWNFQVGNHWMESLDYRYRPVCVNKHGARYNPDGSLTLVIAASDPGVGNFLDTAGHRCGTMILRWTRAQSRPTPSVRVEKLATLQLRKQSLPDRPSRA